MKTVIDIINECRGTIENIEKSSRTERIIFESTVNNSIQSKGQLCTDNRNHSPKEWREVCSIDDFNKCVEEMTNMNIKPVYTQAMVDAGVVPSVPMRCQWNGHNTNITLTFIGDEMFCGNNETNKEVAGYIQDLKPLTPPIELIDGKAYQFNSRNGDTWCGIYHDLRDIFYVDDDQCFDSSAVANIQLLEVKNND